mmetsp:Transcript_14591/g.34748  ORF Transcript_14591/g.34748 Transcript_14591/m.34748 type:complete len:213 (-) Transcript_14591:10-648(-)
MSALRSGCKSQCERGSSCRRHAAGTCAFSSSVAAGRSTAAGIGGICRTIPLKVFSSLRSGSAGMKHGSWSRSCRGSTFGLSRSTTVRSRERVGGRTSSVSTVGTPQLISATEEVGSCQDFRAGPWVSCQLWSATSWCTPSRCCPSKCKSRPSFTTCEAASGCRVSLHRFSCLIRCIQTALVTPISLVSTWGCAIALLSRMAALPSRRQTHPL